MNKAKIERIETNNHLILDAQSLINKAVYLLQQADEIDDKDGNYIILPIRKLQKISSKLADTARDLWTGDLHPKMDDKK